MKFIRSFLVACLLGVAGCKGGKPLLHFPGSGGADVSAMPNSPGEDPDVVKAQQQLALDEGDLTVLAQTARIPVIMFHNVLPKKDMKVWFDCSLEDFQKILDTIEADKLTPITLDQLYQHLAYGTPAPPGAIVLTFDDNYQGFFDNAYPLLKAKNWPSAMFVHTNYVGSQEHEPKMDWPTLQQLVNEKLVTIGCHTLSHPDLTTLTDAQQDVELRQSKQVLEDHLHIKVDYLAYPDGKNNPTSQYLTRQIGYKMAFTVENGPAEESPNLFAVNRYIQTRFDLAVDDCQTAVDDAPVSITNSPLKSAPITYEHAKYAGIDMAVIRGGVPSTRRSTGRQGVLEFIRDANAQAGINGTFFALAGIKDVSNEMVGPVLTSNEKAWVPDTVPERILKIRDRPLVVWGPSRIAYIPFTPGMNIETPIRAYMPDFTDAFVAGVWLVHDKQARTKDQMKSFGAKDAMDPRHRAFFGTMPDGTVILGASVSSIGADKLALAAQAMGCEDAVMMDSGFSTSLVYGDKIIASGHSTPETPSRPVPHAIVLAGTLAIDPATVTVPQPSSSSTHHRRRRR